MFSKRKEILIVALKCTKTPTTLLYNNSNKLDVCVSRSYHTVILRLGPEMLVSLNYFTLSRNILISYLIDRNIYKVFKVRTTILCRHRDMKNYYSRADEA